MLAVVLTGIGFYLLSVVLVLETTSILPTIVGWTLQKYGNSPLFVNLCEYVLAGIMRAVKPESNASPALAVLGVPDVTVCKTS